MSENDEGRPIIYCIEGHWHEVSDPSLEPSVEPMLQMLDRRGQWPYVRRNAATDGELFYWLTKQSEGDGSEWLNYSEWQNCKKGSILYFATHGDKGEIWLGGNDSSSGVPIEKLAMEIDCEDCLVHFGGCSILACDEGRIRHFIKETKAAAASGYRVDVGWTSEQPAVLSDLMLFSRIRDEGINLTDGRSRKKLQPLKEDLQRKFPECGFDLYTKEDLP